MLIYDPIHTSLSLLTRGTPPGNQPIVANCEISSERNILAAKLVTHEVAKKHLC